MSKRPISIQSRQSAELVIGMRHPDRRSLLEFLENVDELFPVSLSEKVNLSEYADKLLSRATLCTCYCRDKLVGLAAGYLSRLENNWAYLAVVGVRPEFQRRGIARRLVQEFIGLCQEKRVSGLHLYTDSTNVGAIRMYEGMGFEVVHPSDDPRPDDVHFAMCFSADTSSELQGGVDGAIVLVTAIGSFSASAVIKGLRSAGFRVIGCDIYPREWIAVASEVDEFYRAPLAKDEERYVDFIKNICEREKVGFVLPLTDVEIDVLNGCRDVFDNARITLCMSPKPTIDRCRNKKICSDFIQNNCRYIRTIPTFVASPNQTAPASYPLVCKPVNGRSSEGLYIVESPEEWATFLACNRLDGYVVQPFIKGNIVTVDVVRGGESGSVVCMPRMELLRTPNGAGTSVRVFSDEALEENLQTR